MGTYLQNAAPKILVVDDNPISLVALEEVLRTALPESVLLTASDGPSGIALARGEDPDVILLDVLMPDMDGFEVCRRLKADEQLRSIPVVFLTALQTNRETRVAALEVGAEGFLGRPPDEHELIAMVRAMAKLKVAHRRTQHELRRGEEQRQQILQTTMAGYWLSDTQGRLLEVNDSYCRMSRYSRRELLTMSVFDLEANETPSDTEAHIAKVTTLGEDLFQSRHRRKDGSTFDVEVGVRYQPNDGGRFVVFLQDITERERAQRALRESEKLLTAAQTAAGLGCYVFDVTADSWTNTPLLDTIFGISAAYTRTTAGWLQLIHPESRDELQRYLADEVLRQGGRFDKQYRIIQHNTGQERWVHGVGEVEYDAKGHPVKMAGTIQDITERRKLQSGLAQSERLASMGLLAAGIAHEINNPLAYVLSSIDTLAQDLPKLVGVVRRCTAALRSKVGDVEVSLLAADDAELLRDDKLDDMVACVNSALAGTRRISTISRSLGTFSRVEGAEITRVNVVPAIEHAATIAQNEIKYRAKLLRELASVPDVLASEGKLAQVFLNLIINAAHAIEEGHVDRNRITLRSWADGDHVYAEVSDTGAGIAPTHRERIFEPFFTTKKPGMGTGLGLSICHSIVADFGGELSVDSTLGNGSRFLVRLPAHRDSAAAIPTTPHVTAEAPVATLARRYRILVVDDELELRRVLTRLLGRDHELHAVASGLQAQALLEKDGAFDLILCDLMMPEMTGMELHTWLLTRAADLAQRLVFISGGGFTPGASEYLATCGNPRIEKPFDSAGLKQRVSELLAESGR